MGLIAQAINMAAGASWGMYAVTFGAVIAAYYTVSKVLRRNLPPGPTPLPLVGSALSLLGRPLHVTFDILRKKYGEIFSIRVANAEVVVINGYENIKKALINNSKKFNGRPEITWTEITQKHGIFSIDGADYAKQKMIIMGILSDVGWDKKEVAELKIEDAADSMVGWLEDTLGEPVDPQIYIDTAVCNVTSEPLMGLKFKPTDELMIAVSKLAMDIFIDAGAQNVNNYFPILRNLPGDPTNYKVLMSNAATAVEVITGVVQSHKERLEENPKAARQDFVDHYLDKIAAGTDPTCTEKQLIAVLTDFFAMGIEATATSVRWGVLLMCQHPEVQKKVQKEIDEVIHSHRPDLKHQQEMCYTKAVIHEIQRYVNIVSINLPHAATEDVVFGGYEIPKGAIVIPNLASVHFDAKTYENPLSFNPERFMANGEFQKPEKFMPYSAGTRTCPGRNISQWQMFILLTTMLQRYDIKMAGPVGEDIYGLIRYPGNFKVVFQNRKSLPNNNANGIN